MGNFETPSGRAPGFSAPAPRVIKICPRCDTIHPVESACFEPKLPQADPWDKQTGHNFTVKLGVSASYSPVNDDWFTVELRLVINQMIHPLSKPILVSRNPDHDPAAAVHLKVLSLAKEHLARGGATIKDVKVFGGDLIDPTQPQYVSLDAWVAGRLGVALEKNPATDLVTVRSVN